MKCASRSFAATFASNATLTALVAAALSWSSASAIAAASTAINTATNTTTNAKHFAWPASFVVLGDGYPHAGDVCRRLGESSATANYLDHTAMLVGCPGLRNSADVHAILDHRRARVVGETDGVTLISIATEGGPAADDRSWPAQTPDKDMYFSTTGTLPCERGGGKTKTMCKYGVVRHGNHSASVVIYWPDGNTRVILFNAHGRVLGAAMKAGDRPMPGNTLTRNNAGINLISIGDERYEIEDAVLSGR
ncbi:hypothetical protein F3J19_15350 [Burkholderia sp. Ax-1724]|nr:hypothetical protein [Burkholderia sp. Ax-1724]